MVEVGGPVAYIISRLCIDCVDVGCVDVCPVACIYAPKEVTEQRPNMLYIHPTECIDCGACEPACPWAAIFEELEVPQALQSDIELNMLPLEEPHAFRVAALPRDKEGRLVHQPRPSPEQVAENRVKWGLGD